MSNFRILTTILTIIAIMASKGVFKNLKKKVDNGETPVRPADDSISTPSQYKESYNLWRGGNPREALELLKNSKMGDVSSYILLGEIYLELKESELAAVAFKKSIAKGATSFAYSRLGELAEMNELYNDGIKLYKKALKYQDAEKGYVYHKLGNLYMYTGQEEKSDKIFEKAEYYHAQGSSTKLSYDFTIKSSKSKSKGGVFLFTFLVIMIVFGISSFVLVNLVSDNNFGISVTETYTNEAIVDSVAVNDENEISDDVVIEDTIVEAVFEEEILGNTNSNINYGGHIVPFGSYIYSFEVDQIVETNEETGEELFVTFANNVFDFNIIDTQLFYIEYDEENSFVSSYSLLNGDSMGFSAVKPWNLLVDTTNMYYLEELAVDTLTVLAYLEEDSIKIEADNVWTMNQTADELFFLKDNIIYSIKKDLLSSDMDLFAEATVLNTSDIIEMAVEESYIFFVTYDDDTIYRMNLDGTSVTSVVSGYDYDSMTLNVYKTDVFIGVNEGEVTYTDVYTIEGEYLGTIDDVIGNQVSNEYIYSYPAE